jgi:outer membrane scaffolding protein for murein synthesis (MipA/OmpV family)
MMYRFIFAVALLVMAGPETAAASGKKPLWEVGVAGGGGYLPDYPAAGEGRFKGLGVPYLIYRGEFIRAGDKGIIRGRLLKSDRIDFDISFDGSFSADSDDNEARRGMPDLDYLGELGPRLQITLAKAARDAKIDLELPLRAVFSTDFSSVDHRGYVFNPALAYQHENFLTDGLRAKLSLNATFADEELMDYFYGVKPAFATARRPVYSAKEGYLGTEVALRLVKRLSRRINMFGRAGMSFHHGASNEDSPLFRDTVTYSAGIGITWSFWQSERTVDD